MSLSRRFGLGRLAYWLYHAPRGFIKRCAVEGPLNLWLSARGQKAMERAAGSLPPTPTAGIDAPGVTFLTGAKFWYQTAFCAVSLLRTAGRPLGVEVLDDGTLTGAQANELTRVLPGVRIHPIAEVLQRLDEYLPADRYPSLRARRLVYPHLRKLTDVHAGHTGWRLVLDSDMLFHRRPDELLGWLASPDRPCHMLDVENAYGYSSNLLTELAGGPVPDRVNVGVCGLKSDDIDWNQLENWCSLTLEREGSHYLQEQALTALLVTGGDRLALSKSEYVVRPTATETKHPTVALHHYVAESKAWYFRFGWQLTEIRARAVR